MSRLKNIKIWILKNKFVFFIILCTVFLRIWRIGDFAMFLADQGRDAIIIKRIVTGEHFPLIGPPSSIGQVYLGPFFYYLVAPFLLLFFLNPVGLAWGVAFYSIVGLIGGYVVIRKLLDAKTALIFLVLTAFSNQLISAARFSWNPNLLPVFSFFTLFFLYKTLKENKTSWAIFFGAFFAFSFQLHHLASLLAFPILLSFLYQMIVDSKKITVLKKILISFAAFCIVSSPLVLFEVKHDFLNIRNLGSLFSEQNMMAGGSPLQRLLTTNHSFWEILLQTSLGQSLSIAFSVLFILVYVFLILKKRAPFFVTIHFINFCSFIYLFSLLSSPRHPHYYGTAYLSFFVVAAFFLRQLLKKEFVPFFAVIMAAYLILNGNHFYFILGKPNNQILHAKKVAESIAPHIGNNPFNFATYPIEFTSEECYLYFLEIMGHPAANRSMKEVTEQMYVLCDRKPCPVLNSGSWNIELFGRAKIDTMWESQGISIYRLIHEN